MFSDYDHKFQYHADTGFSYSPSYKDESFSFQVEAERQYVSRLKMQREKIQALYAKYDTLINELSKKDQIIKQQQKKIGDLDYKCKNFSLMIPELEFMKSQNLEVVQQNQLLKNNLSRLENQYHSIMGELNNKITYTADQRQEISVRNEQLLDRIKTVTKKMEERQIQRTKQQKSLKNMIDTLKKQLELEKNKYFEQLAEIRSELLLKNEQNHHLYIENNQLKSNLAQLAQAFTNEKKMLESKCQQLKYQKKKITAKLKKQIHQLLVKYEQEQKKLLKITEQYQILEKQLKEYTQTVLSEKKVREDQNFHLKMQICQEKSLFRERAMQYQSIISKLQTDISLALRKQADLLKKLQRIQNSENAKRSIRQIQRQQLQKINRIFI